MQTFFVTDPAGNRYEFHLHSLAEYEADGGIYCDGGNGGEDLVAEYARVQGITLDAPGDDARWGWDRASEAVRQAVRAQFVAALSGPHGDDHGDPDAAASLGLVTRHDWYDSATGYYLLREWPAAAPLAARLVESRA